jgi:hypothetical protein
MRPFVDFCCVGLMVRTTTTLIKPAPITARDDSSNWGGRQHGMIFCPFLSVECEQC